MQSHQFINTTMRYKVAPLCPCGKSNRDGKFSPTKDNPNTGFCHSCNKFFNDETEPPTPYEWKPPPPPTYLNPQTERRYLSNYENNNLIKALKRIFPNIRNIEQRAKAYGIGTEQHGKTIFYQIDKNGNIRGGKVMLYDEKTAKRIKNSPHAFNWIHRQRKIKDYTLCQCLFGLHLTKDNKKPIGIVESEKTAFILSLFYDNYHFLATGGKANLRHEILAPIIDREIFLFPDSGEFDFWHTIGTNLNAVGFNIQVSKAIEQHPKGTDLADILINEKNELTNINQYT